MRRPMIAVLLASALTLASCGGDDGAADGKATRLSATEYRAQIARLCTDSDQELSQIGGVQGANAAALAEYFDRIVVVQTRRRMRFERLLAPPDLQDEHAQIVPLLVQEIDAIRQAATSFRAGSDPVSTYEMLKTSQNRALRRQGKLLAKLKVAQCASNTSAAQGSS